MAEGFDLPITPDGQRDKYIGLALAISSSLAIGTSFIITKKVCSSLSCSPFSLGPKLTPSLSPHSETPFRQSNPQGLIDAADRHDGFATDSFSYLKNGIWWAGMVTSEFKPLPRASSPLPEELLSGGATNHTPDKSPLGSWTVGLARRR